LCDIEDLSSYTPALAGESEEWAAIIGSAEDNRENYCKVLWRKTLFVALYGICTVTLNKFKNVVKASTQLGQTKQGDGFKRKSAAGSGTTSVICKGSNRELLRLPLDSKHEH
jgi:hypothetical protein